MTGLPDRPSCDLLVIGAGVLGLASAAVAQAAGLKVRVVDPGGPNASSVAAGMIAPGFEAALEDATAERASLYRHAAALWPGFAARFGLDYRQDGADWRGPADPLAAKFEALGFAVERTAAGFTVSAEGLVAPEPALARLAEGLEIRRGRVDSLTGLDAGRVLVATGWARGLLPLQHAVRPIKGQLLRLGGRLDRVVRGPGVYLAPQADAVVVGATMEPDLADTAVDPAVIEALRARAVGLVPDLAEAPLIDARAGVRGATPDGLPLVGRIDSRTLVALAPRRNGWLLAPLAAESLLAELEGRDPGPWAEALRPDRAFPVTAG